jgi:hypothetical protein
MRIARLLLRVRKSIMSTPPPLLALAFVLLLLALGVALMGAGENKDGRLFVNSMNQKVVRAEYAVRGEVS